LALALNPTAFSALQPDGLGVGLGLDLGQGLERET